LTIGDVKIIKWYDMLDNVNCI